MEADSAVEDSAEDLEVVWEVEEELEEVFSKDLIFIERIKH